MKAKQHNFTGVILAGGLNSRFQGQNKAFLLIKGASILDHLVTVLGKIFDDLIIVSNNPMAYLKWDALLVRDVHSARSAMTGIHAGLFYAATPFVFTVACDIPFLKPEMIDLIVSAAQDQHDVVVPKTAAGYEPLCAVYHQRCRDKMESCLNRGDFKIQRFFRKARVKTISEPVLRKADPELRSFFNVNTPADLARALETLPDPNRKSD